MNDQSSRATAKGATSAASSVPKVPACTKGKWAMSRKLSASRPADPRARNVGSGPTMNAGSSASGMEPSGAIGGSGAMKTMPWASATAPAGVSRAAGGSVAPSPSAGISTQRPSPSKRQP